MKTYEEVLSILRCKTGYVYLASPYSHADPDVREVRFKAVCKAAAILMADGVSVFSPIAHTHPIAIEGDLQKGWDFWKRYDTEMIRACRCVCVLELPGWEASAGICCEINLARTLRKPVHHLPLSAFVVHRKE